MEHNKQNRGRLSINRVHLISIHKFQHQESSTEQYHAYMPMVLRGWAGLLHWVRRCSGMGVRVGGHSFLYQL